MGKFVVHGILIEEPKKINTSSGIDCVNCLVEEKFRTAYSKEIINVYSVNFMGKAVNCVPDGVSIIGCPVVITGTIRSREYKGKYYNDLNGDGMTVIETNTFVSNADSMPRQAQSANLESIEIEDDDLPF